MYPESKVIKQNYELQMIKQMTRQGSLIFSATKTPKEKMEENIPNIPNLLILSSSFLTIKSEIEKKKTKKNLTYLEKTRSREKIEKKCILDSWKCFLILSS